MTRFRYRLQPALDVAHAREREALEALRRARAASAALRVSLAAIQRREREFSLHVGSVVRDGFGAGFLVDVEGFATMLGARRRGRAASLVRADAAAGSAGDAVALEARKRSALERHRERANDAWRARKDLRDEDELDETNAFAQARRALARKGVT